MSITWADPAMTGFYWIGSFECAEVSHRPCGILRTALQNLLVEMLAIDLILSIVSKCLLKASKSYQFIINQTSWKHAEYNKDE